MEGKLSGRALAMLGGDERDLHLANALLAAGARLSVAGIPAARLPAGARLCADPREAVRDAEAIICPMSGTDAGGYVRTPLEPASGARIRLDESTLGACREGTWLLIGRARPGVAALSASLGLRVYELAGDEELAWLNAIPTAEGALALAMANLRVTIHGSRAVVVGFGRCGQQIGRLLVALGALVRAVVFDRAERARAQALGVASAWVGDLPGCAGEADVIFNTAPALVLTVPVLERMRPDAVIVDIASEPGGTDFEAASRVGIQAIHALGLPGRVAPRTAGAILAHVVPEVLASLLAPIHTPLEAGNPISCLGE